MATHIDILIGRIALERGLIDRDQLADCLKEQASLPYTSAPALGSIFLKRGLIKQRDLDSLLDEQKQRLAEAVELTDAKLEDAILGRLLVRQGLATEKQVYECLRVQAELSEQNQPAPKLGDLLVRKGFLTTDAVASALHLAPKAFFYCTVCDARFSTLTHEPGKRYTCKKCDAPLLREDRAPDDALLPVSHGPLPDDVAKAAGDPANRYAGGKYVLIREVGRGGMGVVWKAWQQDLERYIAIKQMSAGLLGDNELKRFFREAQMAASLSHSNIATIYEVGTHEGKHFIAMEYVDGEALSTIQFGAVQSSRHGGRAPRNLPLQRGIQIVREAALAVEYAHSRGVIHRDVKPHNIMLQRGADRVYVMDFGLAKPVRNQDGISMGDTILGTPPYMSPEQARGENVDRRTDVYSLGAVLYYVLTGHAPFSGHSPAETLMKVLADDPQPPRAINPTVPPDLELVALKALEKDKKRRYDSGKALADDLARYLDGQPVRARRQSMAERAIRSLRAHPVAAVASVIGAMAIAIIILAVRIARSRDHVEIAEYVHQGDALLQKQDAPRALVQFEKALALDKWNEAAASGKRACEQALAAQLTQSREWRRQADTLFDKQQYAEALQMYERAAAQLSDAALKARIKLCEECVGKEHALVADLERQVREAQERAEDEKQRHDARRRALALYASARQLIDAAERLKLKSGTAADVRRKYYEADGLLDRCLAEDATYVEALYLRGQIRLRSGDFAGAADDFAATLKTDATFAPAAFGAAITQLVRYEFLTSAPYLPMQEESLKASAELGRAADLAAKLSSDPYERWAAKALSHMKARNYSDASDALGRVAAEGRATRSYYFILAALRVEEKEPAEAIRELTTLLEFDAMSPEALYLRSVLQSRSGDRNDRTYALADAKRLMDVMPDHPYSYLARALAHEMTGAPAAAAKDLEQAGELDRALAPLLKPEIERLLRQ